MIDQYFGHKELYQVTLRAKMPMQFGDRYIEADEPVLYFDNVNMSVLSEQNRPVFARGGWGNMPRVVWEERSEVQFQMVEGVMSNVGMSILLGANVLSKQKNKPFYISTKEDNLEIIRYESLRVEEEVNGEIITVLKDFPVIEIKHKPVMYPIKKTFIFIYDRKAIQQGVYGKYKEEIDNFNQVHYRIILAADKNFTKPAENNVKYAVDYYYEYGNESEALIYSVEKERFNGLFMLEAKFYSKDENEGRNYTNVLYMPKVRIVSNINLRLGERADPTVSTFNIIGMPESYEGRNLICEITRLGEPIDADI